MYEIQVYDSDNHVLTQLMQWDKDVSIQIKESTITKAYNVHFSNQKSNESYVVRSNYSGGTLTAKIPNKLLTEEYPLFGYVYVDKPSGEHRSVYGFRIAVRRRPQPSDYIYTESQDYISITKISDECKRYRDECLSTTKGIREIDTSVKETSAAFDAKVTTAISDITNEGDAQVSAITNKGAEQVGAVTAEGAAQKKILDDTVADVVADREQINQNKTDILLNAIKPNVKGNPVVAKDSADAKVVDLEINSSTNQVQTTGKNLFDVETFIKNKTSYTKNGDFYTITKWNQALYSEPFVFSDVDIDVTLQGIVKDIDAKNSRIVLIDTNGRIKDVTTSNKTATMKACKIRFDATLVGSFEIGNVMLEKGTEATLYEPYSGGKPSPSLEYPQEIVNEVIDNVGCNGKNLIIKRLKGYAGILSDPQIWFEDEKCVSGLIDAKMLSGKTLTASSKNGNRINLAYVDTDTPIQGTPIVKIESNSSGLSKHTFKVDTNPTHKFIVIQFSYKSKADDIQVEIGTEATLYEPYKGFSDSIAPIELSKWDKIKKIDGVWKKEKNTILEQLNDSNSNVSISQTSGSAKRIQIQGKNIPSANVSTIGDIYCNKLKRLTANNTYSQQEGISVDSKGWIQIYVPNINSVQDAKNWLKANTPTIQYLTTEPTYEVLPKETQDVLNKVQTFYPNSVIQTNDGIELNIKYVADTKTYIDNKFNELQTAIVAVGGNV